MENAAENYMHYLSSSLPVICYLHKSELFEKDVSHIGKLLGSLDMQCSIMVYWPLGNRKYRAEYRDIFLRVKKMNIFFCYDQIGRKIILVTLCNLEWEIS